jgi:hypothetical protein
VVYEPSQWVNLGYGVAEVIRRRDGRAPDGQQPRLDGQDAELLRDVFWDLFRQGYITLGLNDSNPNWPFFRLSHFGKSTLAQQSPWRFHNSASFLSLLRSEVPDVSAETLTYLDEAVAAFYAGCLLAACVMLGVAAETEFLRVTEAALASPQHATRFQALAKDAFVRTKITKFRAGLEPVLPSLQPKKRFEDLDTNLSLIQSVLRVARNDAGHPSGAEAPSREQVYVFLQMFVPFARQLMWLREALARPADVRE